MNYQEDEPTNQVWRESPLRRPRKRSITNNMGRALHYRDGKKSLSSIAWSSGLCPAMGQAVGITPWVKPTQPDRNWNIDIVIRDLFSTTLSL